MEQKKISRREFMKAAGFAATASLLAACAPQVVTQVVNQTQVVTQVVPQTQVVVQTQVVSQTGVPQVVTATPAPTAVPAPAVMQIWAITTVKDINAPWDPTDPNNAAFKAEWWTGGMIRAGVLPWLAAHPGVTVNITGHNWDAALRQNIYLALAAGITPDTGYGEAYVTEFVNLGVYAPVSADSQALFPAGPLRAATKTDGKAYGLAETTGANVLFINTDAVTKAGLDPTKLPASWDDMVTMAQAISKVNKDPKYGNNAFFTYAPAHEDIGSILRMAAWWQQNGTPIGSDFGVPSINQPGAADVWVFVNSLLQTSQQNTILNIDATGEFGSAAALNKGIIAMKISWTNDATTVGTDPNAKVVAVQLPIPANGTHSTNLVGNQINSPTLHGPNPALAIDYIESTCTNEAAQIVKPNGCGIWIPALKSMLSQYATFDKLGGFTTDTAKALVRVTMQAALDPGTHPIPGWPKNGNRIWDAWNDSYGKIWKGNLAKADIQKELDTLETTVEGLLDPAA